MGDASLDGPRWKIRRAREHLDTLKADFRPDPETNRIVIEEHGDWKYVVRAQLSDPDLRLCLITGDLVQNARAALDFLTWQLVLLYDGKPGHWTYFPIETEESQFRG